MEIILLPQADKDLEFWIRSGNKATLKKIVQLTNAIIDNPYEGIGKPEQLKYGLSGKWSRRITDEDRLVYEVKDGTLYIFSLKGHYL